MKFIRNHKEISGLFCTQNKEFHPKQQSTSLFKKRSVKRVHIRKIKCKYFSKEMNLQSFNLQSAKANKSHFSTVTQPLDIEPLILPPKMIPFLTFDDCILLV